MDLASWIGVAASLSFAAGVALALFACARLVSRAVPRATYETALSTIKRQQQTIDRLLTRRTANDISAMQDNPEGDLGAK
jgi:hypothetical protein